MSDTASTTSSSRGLGLASILTIIFVIAKITHYIDWSWWWVFSPIWITLSAVLVILAAIFGVVCIVAALE